MIRLAPLAACAALLGCASAPPAPPGPPAPVIVDNPRLVSTPTAADIGRVYPLLAGRTAAPVKVTLLCSPQPDGALALCVGDDAAPVEPAFRIAALRVSHLYRLAPGSAQTVGAAPVLVRLVVELAPPTTPLPVVRAPDELLASQLVHLVRPDGEMMNRFYPERARERGVEGYGEVLCRVDTAGGLSECSLIEEAPLGTGFGTASLRLVRLLRMGPETTTGEPTTGKSVRHRIYWLLPD